MLGKWGVWGVGSIGKERGLFEEEVGRGGGGHGGQEGSFRLSRCAN